MNGNNNDDTIDIKFVPTYQLFSAINSIVQPTIQLIRKIVRAS